MLLMYILCKTPVKMLKKLVSAVSVSSERPYANSISSVLGIKGLGEIYVQLCCLEIFCEYSFDELMDSQNLWIFGSVSLKTVLIFLQNFLNFKLNMSEKQGIINLCSSCKKSYISVISSDSKVLSFLKKECMQPFDYFSIVFCLNTVVA